jgi:hypothetical protein
MRKISRACEIRCFTGLVLGPCLLFLVVAAPALRAQTRDEFDAYKIKLEGFWVYSQPTGTFRGSSNSSEIDLEKTLGFKSVSTFAGRLDWKISHKNHLYFGASPYSTTHETVLNRTIVYQGQTFNVGIQAKGTLEIPVYVIGYQYDILRRRRGHLGISVQANLFDARASIEAAAQVVGSVTQKAVSATNSLLAPIPVAGPDFRLYLTNSPRLFLEGHVYGMYFFGYGNFVSGAGHLGINLVKHLSLKAGYQMGSRLVVKDKANVDRLSLRFTHKGPTAGLEFSF